MIRDPLEPNKTKAAGVGTEAASENTQQADYKAIRSRSTSTESQLLKMRALLRLAPHTTHSLRQQGISHPAGRVLDLRDDGYVIVTERVKAHDSDGFTHINVARYALLKEPPAQPELGLEVQG
jgi:hypothetical protein